MLKNRRKFTVSSSANTALNGGVGSSGESAICCRLKPSTGGLRRDLDHCRNQRASSQLAAWMRLLSGPSPLRPRQLPCKKTPVHKLLGRGNPHVVALDLSLSLRARPPKLWTLAARQCAAFFVTVVTLSGGGSNCFSIPVDFGSPRVLVQLAGSGEELALPRRPLKRRSELAPGLVSRPDQGFLLSARLLRR